MEEPWRQQSSTDRWNKRPARPRRSWPPRLTTKTSVNERAAILVGLCFLTATFTFAIANALIHSYFSSATAHDGLIAGVFLLGCCGLAVAANGAAMRPILKPYTPIRSQAYYVLRVTECLTLVSVGAYFLTSHAQWNAYVLAVYAVSGTAGLVLSSALLTSRIVPRKLSMLGLIGYPVFLVGTILAMFRPDRRNAWRRNAGAGPRRPLRVDPAYLAVRQGI